MRMNETYRRPKNLLPLIVLFVCVGIVLFYPYKTTVVPAWGLRVVDESGNPVIDMPVNYSWQDYSLENVIGPGVFCSSTDKIISNGHPYFSEYIQPVLFTGHQKRFY